MAESNTPDLGKIETKILDSLESNLAHTLGQVKAFQRIAEEITSTERDIRRHKALSAQIEADLKTNKSKELQAELEGEKSRIQRLERIHTALATDLAELAEALHTA